ncbi:alpha/beta hydrolase family protein [Pararhodobacter sp.]|uniref:alpha/beta hydrolase family protein n=1 Tax=Pararhodobacter sp. TaxID=2127056 RepID=UPI002AFEDA33|nr:alpha/beta fold hydrolase [Pararhodobacter sp.]
MHTRSMMAWALALTLTTGPLMAENRVDASRPDAPELAANGAHVIGVRTLTLTDPDRPDVLASTDALVRGPRTMLAEFWYPAAADTTPGGTYETVLRDGVTPTALHGQAARNATPSDSGPFPLVVISHGYPGNRVLMAHLAEHLATHGYAVLALDHTDSTYADQAAFGSTLYNRPLDQAFALNAMEADASLADLVSTEAVGVIGYSMGGYGALVFSGAGLVASMVDSPFAPPQGLLAAHVAGSDTHEALPDPRVRATVAIGPWGMNSGLWDAAGLAGLRVPTLLIAGSMDTISGYDAIRTIFDGAVNTDRHLLTYENAGHNAAAPIPAPAESYAISETLGWAPFAHYADPVWDTLRMNEIAQHFVLAFLDLRLRGMTDRARFLDVIENANEGQWAVENGQQTADHTAWAGFQQGTAVGLRFESHRASE